VPGLDVNASDSGREARRRDSIASLYRPDPALDQMERLYKNNPSEFDATFGPHGHIVLGLRTRARRAAAGRDPNGSEGDPL
jgi:hypothetical protein